MVIHINKIVDIFLNSSEILNCDGNEEVNYVLIKIPYIGDNLILGLSDLRILWKLIIVKSVIFSSFKVQNYFSLKTKNSISNVYKFTCHDMLIILL